MAKYEIVVTRNNNQHVYYVDGANEIEAEAKAKEHERELLKEVIRMQQSGGVFVYDITSVVKVS